MGKFQPNPPDPSPRGLKKGILVKLETYNYVGGMTTSGAATTWVVSANT